MNNFKEMLQIVPGFRSNTTWKKVISIIYYLVCLLMLAIEFHAFLFFSSLPFFIFYIISSITNKIKKQPVKKELISAGLAFALMVGSISSSPTADSTEKDKSKDLSENQVERQAITKDLEKESTKTVKPIPIVLKEKKEEIKKETQENIPSNFIKATVTKHVDGDTVHVTDESGQVLKIRMIGVDTPETVHPSKPVEYYGKEASDYTKEHLFNKTVYLEKDVSDTDRYGRSLRYVWLTPPNDPKNITKDEVKTKMFNALLLSNGFANVSTYPPDVKYQSYFSEFETGARNTDTGLWAKEKTPIAQTPSNNNNENVAKSTPKPTPTVEAPVQQESTGSGLVITMTGKKYHKASCRTVKQVKQSVTAEQAESMGYTACKVCSP